MFLRRPFLLASCIAILLILVSPGGHEALLFAQAQQPFPVNLAFVARDKKKQFVKTLRKEDIRILEDGVPQEIVNFRLQDDQPLSLALLIDTSASQERTLPNAKQAARDFIDSIMRPGQDAVAVISFTHDPQVEAALTINIEEVRRAIDAVEFVPPPGYIGGGVISSSAPHADPNSLAGSTAIWNVLWLTSENLLKPSPANRRRAIIILTDGVDSSSQKKIDDVVKSALSADVVIYAIGIGDEYYGGVDRGPLRKVAEKTGGRAFVPNKKSELTAVFAEIEGYIHSQYFATYMSKETTPQSKPHKIKIELANPELRKQNIEIFSRSGLN